MQLQTKISQNFTLASTTKQSAFYLNDLTMTITWTITKSVDYNEIKKSIQSEPFSPVCHTNINRMCEELYDYLENLANQHVPRKTRRRQSLPPWIKPSTSNIMNKLRT